jgi:hypothetical protein
LGDVERAGREVLAGRIRREVGAGITDRRDDLGPGSDDARVLHQPFDTRFSELRYNARIESREALPQGVPPPKNGQPSETGLRAVEHQLFPKRSAVTVGHAPFFVVISSKQRAALGLSAPIHHLSSGYVPPKPT